MLDSIERYLPLCKEEWDAVLQLHNQQFKDFNRTTDSLKRKFSSMHRKKMPTGDPLMTDDVRRAKHLRHNMTDRADMGVAEDAEEVVESFMPSCSDTPGTESDMAGVEAPSSTENDDVMEAQSVPVASLLPDSPENDTPSPRPLINRRSGGNQRPDGSSDIFAIMKANLMQEHKRREDEAKRREEERTDERLRREDERREDKLFRDQETKRQERFMEMMMMVMTQRQSTQTNEQQNGSGNGGL